MNREVKDICIIAILLALLVVQEQLLQFIPNVQLTIFFILLYAKKLGFVKSEIIVVSYTTIDCAFSGYFNIFFYIAMLVGWSLIPILMNTIFKKIDNHIWLSLLAVLFSFLYSWILIISSCLLYKLELIPYFIADLPYELILAASSLLSTFILYISCSRVFDKLYKV